MDNKKRVAIIGSGASGLPAIKCVREEGMVPVCFERTDDIGGLWNYKPTTRADGQSSIMKSTVINTSKEKMCYSDFPIPKEFPNFMHNTKVLEYFRLYAKEFDLLRSIRFNTEVIKVERSEQFKETGRWKLYLKDNLSGSESEEIYDAVLVCTGHHGSINLPNFPGSDEFKGKQLHTHDFKSHEGYEDKRVLVVGIGNSAVDVAVELGKCAKQVFLSTKRGAWVLHRIAKGGLPIDLVYDRRYFQDLVIYVFPPSFTASAGESICNERFDHNMYGLKPKHRLTSQHPTVNDDLPNYLLSGSITVRPNIQHFTTTGVEFEDGTKEEDIDAVIYGTGYNFGFPFLAKDIVKVKKEKSTD